MLRYAMRILRTSVSARMAGWAGMEGFPIHVLTLRFSDPALPPSDCTQSRAQVDELSMGRTQMVLQRDR